MASSLKTILVTGGSGFIGSHFVRLLLQQPDRRVVNVDKLSYAATGSRLGDLEGHPGYTFHQLDLGDEGATEALDAIFAKHLPDAVVHLAAESHVDRSIDGPDAFIRSNLNGTAHLLQAALAYWRDRSGPAFPEVRSSVRLPDFRFLHVSTDEVYGSLRPDQPACLEGSPYAPNSPYAASKAGADHLVRAWQQTYGLPTLLTHATNNYGPAQFPEKLIPTALLNGLRNEPIPLYGDGQQCRNWLFVRDHCRALLRILENGQTGESYHTGGRDELANRELVVRVCRLLDELHPADRPTAGYASLITRVADRPGHDRRYALDDTKIRQTLGWESETRLDEGLRETILWYLDHRSWWEPLVTEKGGALRRRGLGASRED